MPNYCVGLGFGLHQGWAIEGAIGSYFKIDASYLSPNVNLSQSLEGYTKIYNVKILISQPMFDILSQMVQGLCREIDRVFIKGTEKEMRLYTIDVTTKNCVEEVNEMLFKSIKEKKKAQDQIKRNLWENKLRRNHITSFAVITEDKDWKELRSEYN